MASPDYQHPAFPQPSNPNATLWRYMDKNKFKWLVSEGRLFMPAAPKLGDPFEGTTPQGELNWWREEATRAASDEERHIIEQNRVRLSAFAKGFLEHYYVSCWHMNCYENYALWKIYTKSEDAVAIQTTLPALRDCLPEYVNIGMVKYIDYLTERLPTMNMFEYIMHKRIEFSFEQEIRAVASGILTDQLGGIHLREHLFEKEDNPSFKIFAPPIKANQLIQRIVLPSSTTTDLALEIKSICAAYALPLPELSAMDRRSCF